ncbi:hypothetical protein VMCG_10819 [Cytospora schulzeri]|uniref:FAD-binding PCMH-type domain-containing protein n=1 Tax=Cytospora schulzeri TaxID=448051 RepID=A0A423V831_9PEZI|nr:hypothetical protein VMCG_10819 [Valsa malicola]
MLSKYCLIVATFAICQLQSARAIPSSFQWSRAAANHRGGRPPTARTCKNIPGDEGWPTEAAWSQLNDATGGRLIATKPLANVCHDPDYDSGACRNLEDNWLLPYPHVQDPTSVIAPYFQNQSCDPFTGKDTVCVHGNYPVYAINATEAAHVQAGVRFARHNNVRLVVKNTGHEHADRRSLLGKSTGLGSLSIWTHNLRSINHIKTYHGDGSSYAGAAVRLGAGVLVGDAMEWADSVGARVTVGSCPTVGVAGGYTAGGGHGLLTSLYGMAADSVLEWEVVLPNGELVTATPHNDHADLYWALSGGGAGTFGIIVSMTTRIYFDGSMVGATFSFDVDSMPSSSHDEFWDTVVAVQSTLGSLVDAGAVAAYAVVAGVFSVYAVAMPGTDVASVEAPFVPIISAVQHTGVRLNVTKTAHNGFLDLFNTYLQEAVSTTPQAQISLGRMIPRSLLEDNSTAAVVADAMRFAGDQGFSMSCVAVNGTRKKDVTGFHPNAVFPLWREALLHCIWTQTWNFSAPWAEMVARQDVLTNVVMPKIEAATPGGGAYLNEANFEQDQWQENFYGENYRRLIAIKDALDPTGILYARTAVGSEGWVQDGQGRLCPV